MGFVHLHVHSEYSLLDGACRIKEMVKRAKAIGQDSLAITDHGVMYGVIDFYKAAKKAGIKPIIGCEVYVAPRTRFNKEYEHDTKPAHLVLLCENETGYRNLCKLVSLAWIDGFYSRPRVDKELLEHYHEGLICLSACLAGELPTLLLGGMDGYAKAKEVALWYREVFGADNYFIEIQDHGLAEQRSTNPSLIKLSNETGIPLVCTNDVHYLEKSDAKMQEVLICIQTNTTLDEPSGMSFSTEEFYLKSETEMRALFPEISSAFDNTVKIAERCNVDFVFGQTQLPVFHAPEGEDGFPQTSADYFKKLCREGMRRLYGETPAAEVTERLDYEINTIESMGYIDYYLIVNDFVQFAKNNDIPVGPGRGSGAGSLCAYCLGITGIDPIKYQLLFERFLNPERVTMPDFDIDFCNEKRPLVIDYVNRKYGEDHVSQIVTFGTMAARSAIRDVARAMNLPYATADKVAKLVPWQIGITIKEAVAKTAELKKLYGEDYTVRELITMAEKVEGMPRHASTHAAGVVITADPTSDYVPLCLNGELIATQFPMGTLEELGLLKMDFLGLRNLTVLDYAKKMIQHQKPGFSLEDIPLDAPEVFEMMTAGNTEGVFQFESPGMKRVMMNLKPDCFEDLIAVISLYRPGPMDSIPKYIHLRHHPEQIKYLHPLLEPILSVTNSCIVYQEQVMQIFRELAGYSLGRADIVRRAMSKKKHDVMALEHEIFVHGLTDENGNVVVDGCVRRGVPERVAEIVFEDMSSFASYAFNKAHAAAYAMVAYQTAWFKCNHPKEYMAALLTSVLDGSGKVATYIAECHRLEIEVLPPSVNESNVGFTVTDEGIRFGLLAVKNVGRGLIEEIVKERESDKGKFTNFYDFCERISPRRECNVRAVDSLIKSGALDGLGANRRQMLAVYVELLSSFDDQNRRNIAGQIGLFDDIEIDSPQLELPPFEEFLFAELLAMEKELVGLYISGHPLTPYATVYENPNVTRIDHMLFSLEEQSGEFKDGDDIILVGMLESVRRKTIKSGDVMAYAVLEDLFSGIEMLVFPKVLARFYNTFEVGNIVLVRGRISARDDESPKIMVDVVEALNSPADIMNISLSKRNNNYNKNQDTRVNTRPKSGWNNKNGFSTQGGLDNGTNNEGREVIVNNNTNALPEAVNPKSYKPKSARHGLYLKVSSNGGEDYNRACLVTRIFEGKTPLYFRFIDSGKIMRAPAKMSVETNDVMLKELKRILGEDSVAYLA